MWFYVLHVTSAGNLYHIFGTSLPPLARKEMKSGQAVGSDNCSSRSSTSDSRMYPVKEIDFPLADVELAYPITVRQVQ